MYALTAVTLVAALAYVHAGGIGLGVGLTGSIDSGAVIAGPSGTVTRTGLASVGPIAAPGLITAGVVPGTVVTGAGLGLATRGLAINGLGLGGLAGLGGLGINAPGLAAKALGLEGSGIEGQWIPDINEQLHDDGSYRPGLDH